MYFCGGKKKHKHMFSPVILFYTQFQKRKKKVPGFQVVNIEEWNILKMLKMDQQEKKKKTSSLAPLGFRRISSRSDRKISALVFVLFLFMLHLTHQTFVTL